MVCGFRIMDSGLGRRFRVGVYPACSTMSTWRMTEHSAHATSTAVSAPTSIPATAVTAAACVVGKVLG